MRKTIAYYLLLIYLSAIISPTMPLLVDVVAHNFNQAVHISTIHMVYGKNHVDSEIAVEAAKNKNDNHESSIKSQTPITLHLLQRNVQFSFESISYNAYSTLFQVNKLPFWFPVHTTPPPDNLG
jgi:hypothetical protein